jgi:hypothetical protein
MAAGDQGMVAHMGMHPVRQLHAAAHILVVAPADFHHLVAQDRIGNPSDDAIEQVTVELAGQPAGACGLRPIADLDAEGDHLEGFVLPSVVAVGGRGIAGRETGLDEACRVGPDHELAIARGRILRIGLVLRVHGPGEIAVDEFRDRLLALHRESSAAAAGHVISLYAHKRRLGRLAAEVDRVVIVLRVGARQVALGELLPRVADPASTGHSERLHAACADRFVGGLQQGLGGSLVRVWRVLRHRRPGHQGRDSKEDSQIFSHTMHSSQEAAPRGLPD